LTNHSGDDLSVLKSALSWLQSGQQVALVTVIKTWGSSPRPPGSLMAMNQQGKYTGSVSGGCVEEELLERFIEQQFTGRPQVIDFGVDVHQASQLGLPCGGQLSVLVEVLDDKITLKQLVDKLEVDKLVARRVELDSGKVELLPGEAEPEIKVSENYLVKTFGPAWHLLIVGNGQIATHLGSMARQLDYQVTICDPREVYAEDNPVMGVTYSKQMPDDAIQEFNTNKRLAIIALAHDPRQDDLAMTAALESQAFYIGALGSKLSAEKRRQRLQLMGYTLEQLEHIKGPVGLDIGSKRPAEIAVSILAHMIAVRNGK
jgi:xanthine dehydrogenase accessory factor